tara:strand:+ start:1125 stop:2732 length:1608 start_codon:yes stop_codon:yes gene_type:complete
MIYLNRFFLKLHKQIRNFYLHSKIYDKKISKTNNQNLVYKPSPHLLSSLIKYQKKRIKINSLSIENFLINENIDKKEFKKLNTFNWFLSLDLKSSKKNVQSVVSEWIRFNYKYNSESWEFGITAKRIIAWLSCHNLTISESNKEYMSNFNNIIQKQTNHLISEIEKVDTSDDKLIASAAIILVGLSYRNEKIYLSNGIRALKKISKISIDSNGFPKSRNIKQLVFFLKYFILIREWFKESHILLPEFINETIYYLGQGYAFTWQNINSYMLFNGNNNSNNEEFDNYLKSLGYTFKNENLDFGGYAVLKNKKICLSMDVGSSPGVKYSQDYQSGALSFEIISNHKKLISNCGYYRKDNIKLNEISKSTAAQNTLIIDDQSSCKFDKIGNLLLIKKGLRVSKKKTIFNKDYWKINASHDGYLKRYNSIHERSIEFFPNEMLFVGSDKIIKKNNKNYKFDIRFHVEPNVKIMKTQDNKTVLIELENEGWRFTCENYKIDIDNGLYFGNKNSYSENQNFYITGISNNLTENINWQLKRI